jgi:hypothetical protein
LLAAKGHAGTWFRALSDLVRWMPSLPDDRRGVRAFRRVPDRAILSAAPLVVRPDVAGRAGLAFKRVYDAWLAGYWRIASRLLGALGGR